jgi:cytokinin dehydrogenase
MLISEMEDRLHTFDYIEGFVVMNNQDPINGLKSVPFSPDADQAVSGMSSNMLPSAVAASSVLYYLEAAVGYNLVDVGPVLENVKTLLQHPVDPSSSAFVLHDHLL